MSTINLRWDVLMVILEIGVFLLVVMTGGKFLLVIPFSSQSRYSHQAIRPFYGIISFPLLLVARENEVSSSSHSYRTSDVSDHKLHMRHVQQS